MITITMPDWIVWALIAMFFMQWIMNGVLAFQNKKLEKSRQSLIKTLESTTQTADQHSKAFRAALDAVRFMGTAPATEVMQ